VSLEVGGVVEVPEDVADLRHQGAGRRPSSAAVLARGGWVSAGALGPGNPRGHQSSHPTSRRPDSPCEGSDSRRGGGANRQGRSGASWTADLQVYQIYLRRSIVIQPYLLECSLTPSFVLNVRARQARARRGDLAAAPSVGACIAGVRIPGNLSGIPGTYLALSGEDWPSSPLWYLGNCICGWRVTRPTGSTGATGRREKDGQRPSSDRSLRSGAAGRSSAATPSDE
jgi:hypothetical protein